MFVLIVLVLQNLLKKSLFNLNDIPPCLQREVSEVSQWKLIPQKWIFDDSPPLLIKSTLNSPPLLPPPPLCCFFLSGSHRGSIALRRLMAFWCLVFDYEDGHLANITMKLCLCCCSHLNEASSSLLFSPPFFCLDVTHSVMPLKYESIIIRSEKEHSDHVFSKWSLQR